jgi:hypothetical protein
MELVLDVHICDQRRSYRVTFAPGNDQVAANFVNSRRNYCAIMELAEMDHDAPAVDYNVWPLFYDALYPTCEHGLSLQLCEGPDHYMSAAQERERYG